MNRLLMIGAWLLLLVSTTVIGVIALRLLNVQQEQIAQTAVAAAMQHAESVAENISLAVTDVQDALLESLHGLPTSNLPQSLPSWERSNPLVRNVFIQQVDGPVLQPDPERPATDEEAGFLKRYEALFEGRVAWGAPPPDTIAVAQSSQSFRQQRKELVAWGKGMPAAPTAAEGWLPWFYDNQLFLLGWIEQEGLRYGVELELVTVLSRLIESIPDPTFSDGVLALLDGQGRILHQRGATMVDNDTPRLVSVQIGEALPHWQISIFAAEGTAAPAGGAVTVISRLVVGTFLAAILLGGSLLLWQAHRNLLDAQQKTSFVSNVSHELKTPLTTIRMYAELMGENRVTDEDKRSKYMRVIVEESQRLTRLVNNVLDFSRLEQGRKNYQPERLNLGETLHAVLDTQQLRMQEAGMELRRNIPTDPLRVNTDRDALEQVILNLVDNAIKYAGNGGELAVEAEASHGTCTLRFMDRGAGIDAAHREQVFEKFHRIDDSLTARQPGSGLGLTIARHLARDLGGDLQHQARPEGGCCFTLTLPIGNDE